MKRTDEIQCQCMQINTCRQKIATYTYAIMVSKLAVTTQERHLTVTADSSLEIQCSVPVKKKASRVSRQVIEINVAASRCTRFC